MLSCSAVDGEAVVSAVDGGAVVMQGRLIMLTVKHNVDQGLNNSTVLACVGHTRSVNVLLAG
jgi:hypothetical protein